MPRGRRDSMPPELREAGGSVTGTLPWASCPGWGSATGTRSARRLALAMLGRPGPQSGSEMEMGYVRQWARAKGWAKAKPKGWARAMRWAKAKGWAKAKAKGWARAKGWAKAMG